MVHCDPIRVNYMQKQGMIWCVANMTCFSVRWSIQTSPSQQVRLMWLGGTLDIEFLQSYDH